MACASINAGLNANACTVNPGGVAVLYLANYEDLVSIGLTGATSTQTPLGSMISTMVGPGGTGSTVGFFYEYQLPKNTASATESAQYNNDALSGFLQTITFLIDGFSQDARDRIMQMSKSLVVAVVQLVNGDLWAYGTENGLSMTAMEDTTGVARTDRQGYTITFSETESHMPYIVSESVTNGGPLVGWDDFVVVD